MLTTIAFVVLRTVVAQRASSEAWPIAKPPPWKFIRRGCFSLVCLLLLEIGFCGGLRDGFG